MAAVVLAAFAHQPLARASQEPAWRTVEPGLALEFPADHGAHPEHRTEWWYLTGHLEDEDGARFGFQFTIFRQGLEPGLARAGESPLRARHAFAGHLALTDVARGETLLAERLRRESPLARASRDDMELVLEDWSLARGPDDELRLAASDPARGFGLELALRAEKPLVLHGERGYSRKGGEPGNASAYVSWTRLAVTGTLRRAGGAKDVRGSAWYDHEFSSSALPAGVVGWDWFALQLDDGRELMLFVLRDERGAPSEASAATLVERDGSARPLDRDAFVLRSRASWTSPTTGATYPARWTLAVPLAGLELELVPLVADCELLARASTDVTYWEGPLEVRGSATGRGYAELTGYAGSIGGRF